MDRNFYTDNIITVIAIIASALEIRNPNVENERNKIPLIALDEGRLSTKDGEVSGISYT